MTINSTSRRWVVPLVLLFFYCSQVSSQTSSDCLSSSGKRAVAACEQQLKLVPENTNIRIALAEALSGQGHHSQAVKILREGLEFDPDHVKLNRKLKLEESILAEQAWSEKRRSRYSSGGVDTQTRLNIIRCNKLKGKKALAACDAGLATAPDNPDLLAGKGDALLDLNRVSDAIPILRKAKRADPSNQQAGSNLRLAESKRKVSAGKCFKLQGKKALAACDAALLKGEADELQIQRRRGDILSGKKGGAGVPGRAKPAQKVPAAPKSGVMSFEAAIPAAANKVFSNAPKSALRATRQSLVIDPLIDGLSGTESVATQAMESKIVELVRTNYKQFNIKNFTASDAARSPYLVIGTFTGVNKQRKTKGVREAFRICLALLDLKSGKVASKAKVFSQTAGVDITPTAFFRDSPAWIADPSVQAYIKTCQATKLGDPIDPRYVEHFKAAVLINEAVDAYERKLYGKSKKLFQRALQTKGGKQLRTYNGLYLTSLKLGQRKQAAEAFGDIVDFGLNNRGFGIKFSFKAGSTDFKVDSQDAGQHGMWLTQLAKRSERRGECLEIVGHTHREGPELLNQRLSIRRAEYIKRRLEAEAAGLSGRMIASGKGSAENLIGSGAGDMTDALDRRIEFDAIRCSPSE